MNIGKENTPNFRKLPIAREVAAGIAATLFLFLSALMIPVVGFFVGIFAPLPSLLFFYRWGSPLGYAVPGGAALVGIALLYYLHMFYGVPYFLQMLLLGLTLAIAMRNQWSIEKTIGSSSLLIFIVGAFFFWVMNGGEAGIIRGMEHDLHETLTAILQQYGTTASEKAILEQTLAKSIPAVVRLLPGIALSSTLIAAWLNVLVTLRYCRHHQLPLPAWSEWSNWKSPDLLVWAVIAGGFLALLPQAPLKIVGQNVLLVLATVYLFQGLAILAFYFERWKIPRILRGIFYGFLFLQLFATLGATLMGLFDVWFDFRRISQKPAEGART
jgi:uncharacterized protein YybS (DUF2232 family)